MNRKSRSIHMACQGVLSIDEAAELLRADPAIIEESGRLGELPTVRMGERMYIDGPALLSQFTEPAREEHDHAS